MHIRAHADRTAGFSVAEGETRAGAGTGDLWTLAEAGEGRLAQRPPGQHSRALLSVSLQLSFLGFCLSWCQAGGLVMESQAWT